MDTSFIQKLRMDNIFGGDTPLGMPTMNSGPDFYEALNKIYPLMALEKQKQRDFQEHMFKLQQEGQLKNIAGRIAPFVAEPERPTNYLAGPSVNNVNPIDAFMSGGMTPYQAGQLSLGQAKIGQTGAIASGKMGIEQQRLAIQKFKAENPGMKILTPKGGNFVAVNPVTGETHDLGIDTGIMTDDEKLQLTGEQKLEEIGARGEIQKDIQKTRGSQALEQIGARITGQKELEGIRQDKPLLPTQERVGQINKARELANTNPDLAPFVHFDASGNFTIDAPSDSKIWGHSGPTQEQYDKIKQHLYGTEPVKKPTEKKKELADPAGIR